MILTKTFSLYKLKKQNITNFIILLTLIIVVNSCGNFRSEKDSAESSHKSIKETNFSTQIYSVEEISFTNEFGTKLSGTLFESNKSKIAIVFAHSFVPGNDQSVLIPLAKDLAEIGITSLTFDFPGHGKTGGPPRYSKVDGDVRAAITYLREIGYSKIASLGIGLGGLGSAKNAPDLIGLITISIPTGAMPDLFVEKEDFSTSYPKLFIAAKDDFANNLPFAGFAHDMHDLSVDPSEVKIFSGRYHSMALFRSEHKTELHDLIIDFFKSLNEKY